jgi:hypothetical protein
MNQDAQLIRWITDGLEGGELITPVELLDGIVTGRFQLFRYPKGCVVTKITEHFGRRRLLVFLLSGEDFQEWKHRTTADLKAFARLHGIQVIDAYARLGLEKVLKSEGWRKEQVVLRLRLEKEKEAA